jgi:hypothetical protein
MHSRKSSSYRSGFLLVAGLLAAAPALKGGANTGTGSSPQAAAGLEASVVTGPIDVAAVPSGGSRVLQWEGDRLTIQWLDAAGQWSSTTAAETSSTWVATAIAGDGDGRSRVLWRNSDGRSAVEIRSPAGRESVVLLPALPEWIPVDVTASPDGSSHILRTRNGGAMHVDTVDESGETSGPIYGGASPGWSAIAIDDASDGSSWVLWRNTDGRSAASVHLAGILERVFRWDGEPGFTVEDIAVGYDGRARILVTNVAGQMRIDTVDAAGLRAVGTIRESFGLRPRRIASSDRFTHVLWTDGAVFGEVWLLNPDDTVRWRYATPVTSDEPAAGNVAGEWVGTFDSVDPIDCLDYGVPASATFTQVGEAVEGTLNAEWSGCGASNVHFRGTLRANRLEGIIRGGHPAHFSRGATATGTLQGSTLELELVEPSPFPFPIPGGRMRLHR